MTSRVPNRTRPLLLEIEREPVAEDRTPNHDFKRPFLDSPPWIGGCQIDAHPMCDREAGSGDLVRVLWQRLGRYFQEVLPLHPRSA